MQPPFHSNVIGMVSDLRGKTLKGHLYRSHNKYDHIMRSHNARLHSARSHNEQQRTVGCVIHHALISVLCAELGKDTALVDPAELAAQQAQVMHTCELLGGIASMVAKAEQGRSTRVVGDTLKDTVVAQQRIIKQLKEQVTAQQHYANKATARSNEFEVALETAKRRLKNEMKKAHDLEVQNKQLRIKVLDSQVHVSQGSATKCCNEGGDVSQIPESIQDYEEKVDRVSSSTVDRGSPASRRTSDDSPHRKQQLDGMVSLQLFLVLLTAPRS